MHYVPIIIFFCHHAYIFLVCVGLIIVLATVFYFPCSRPLSHNEVLSSVHLRLRLVLHCAHCVDRSYVQYTPVPHSRLFKLPFLPLYLQCPIGIARRRLCETNMNMFVPRIKIKKGYSILIITKRIPRYFNCLNHNIWDANKSFHGLWDQKIMIYI